MAEFNRYDDLAIGAKLPTEPYRYEVTAEAAAAYRAIGNAVQVDAAATGDFVEVPPMMAAVYIRGAQNALKGPPGGIHAKQRFQFKTPVRIGDSLSTTLEVVEKYEKKGRRYIVCATSTVNQDGVEVTQGQITSIWGQES